MKVAHAIYELEPSARQLLQEENFLESFAANDFVEQLNSANNIFGATSDGKKQCLVIRMC